MSGIQRFYITYPEGYLHLNFWGNSKPLELLDIKSFDYVAMFTYLLFNTVMSFDNVKQKAFTGKMAKLKTLIRTSTKQSIKHETSSRHLYEYHLKWTNSVRIFFS